MIGRWTRGRRLTRRLFFAGGHPRFHLLPRWLRWGPNLSLFWLDAELVLRFGRLDDPYRR